jgi:molybdopterin-containing oxidoreductase family membrane subunit
MLLMCAVTYLFVKGTGIWGVNIPVGDSRLSISSGGSIGHAGTLISAICPLNRVAHFHQSLRRSDDAVGLGCAGLYPILHLGRPWFAYWLIPYPNTMDIWPQFRSPLVWDVFAVSTYATVSLLFWYVGLIPDMATLRDRSSTRLGRVAYGMLAMGWRGWPFIGIATTRHAAVGRARDASRYLVHTVVSFDSQRSFRDGTPPSSRLISLPGPSIRASQW